MKKLYKSSTQKMVAGVCGGIAEYFGIDVTIVRILFLILSIGGGSGLLIYIIAAVIIPDAPVRTEPLDEEDFKKTVSL